MHQIPQRGQAWRGLQVCLPSCVKRRGRKAKFKRHLRAQLRDGRALFRESRASLILFVIIVVVMRLFDPDLARRVEKGFGIHTAFSTSALAAPIFATAAMRLNVKHSFYVGDTLLNLSQVTIEPGSPLIGWPIERLESEFDLSVVCYQGAELTDLHPAPGLCLNPGDQILILASLAGCRREYALNLPGSLNGALIRHLVTV